MSGWIKLHRSLRKHWLMDDPEYLRAWVLILMEVNHSKQKVLIKKVLLECSIGESLNSYETWGKLFGKWSKSKTVRFLKLLQEEKMIALKSERVTTRLSVCNYAKYQDTRNASDTLQNPQEERGRSTNKNVKKEKNEEEEDSFSFKNFKPKLQ